MVLLRDVFDEQLPALEAAGWVIESYTRYQVTHVEGFTPSGKAFTLHAEGSVVTITVAGRTKTLNVAQSSWEPAAGLVAAWTAAHRLFPVNQR
jgi:hypothetical protein